MKSVLHIVISLFVFTTIQAQEFNPHINKDSLFNVLIKNVHPSKITDLTKSYFEGDDEYKDFLIMMLHFPRSSKAEMIANLKKNRDKIFFLRSQYAKLVPKNYTVYIEFNPEDKIFRMPATIDLHIYGPKKMEDDQEWHIEYGSEKLKERLKRIGWERIH